MSEKLVIMHDRQAVTTSLQVAKTFGKDHRHVLDSIRGILSSAENSAVLDGAFAGGIYTASNGKTNPMYYMNRDGFTLLAMGFTGEKAFAFKLDYIHAFNSMEIQVQSGFAIPQNLPEALRMAADQQERIEKMQPKVDYFDVQMHNPGLMTTTVIAKAYGMSARSFNGLLQTLGIIYRQGQHWVIRQQYAKNGYTGYDNWASEDNREVHPLLKWTQKGQKFLYDELKQLGMAPIAEQMALLD